jgi:hypothetical protein
MREGEGGDGVECNFLKIENKYCAL